MQREVIAVTFIGMSATGKTLDYDTIQYAVGNEWGPDDPYGTETLILHADGLVEYKRSHRDMHWVAEARTEASRVQQLGAGLRAAGFPAIPDHKRPPGGNVIRLCATGGQGAGSGSVYLHTGITWEGYGQLISQCQGWCKFFRGYPKSEVPDTLREPRLVKLPGR